MRENVRAYEVTMIVHASSEATVSTVMDLIHDLTWVGGHRHPEDPAIEGLKPSKVTIKRKKELDKK